MGAAWGWLGDWLIWVIQYMRKYISDNGSQIDHQLRRKKQTQKGKMLDESCSTEMGLALPV